MTQMADLRPKRFLLARRTCETRTLVCHTPFLLSLMALGLSPPNQYIYLRILDSACLVCLQELGELVGMGIPDLLTAVRVLLAGMLQLYCKCGTEIWFA